MRTFLPVPVHVSFLNEYDCVLEFPTEFELHKIAGDLHQISQWFGWNVVITCEVVSKDMLDNLELCKIP